MPEGNRTTPQAGDPMNAGLPLRVLEAPPSETVAQRSRRESGEFGFVHSVEPASTVDGPGIRYVTWTTGCLMRCQYCHNPDTWKLGHGKRTSVDELMQDVEKFTPFLKAAGGGFTVSGGEPMAQSAFVLQLMKRAKSLGLHTALDTNGYLGDRVSDADFDAVDLVLLDLKSYDAALHQRVTATDVAPILEFARRLDRLGQPTWVRFVLVPGLTDEPENVRQLAAFTAALSNVERVEILPFHQMGRNKWHELGYPYPLETTQAPTQDLVESVRQCFAQAGAPVV